MWDFQETVGGWRGQAEVDCLAAADRIRQREEQEKQAAEGSWTDCTHGETEQAPDDHLERMEWQIKTRGREAIRESAEAEGIVCYYPDGSYREGLSGWGWVSHQKGVELSRDYGPVKLYGEQGWEGAQYHSNNAGELTAVIRVLQHAKASGHTGEIMIAPDNLWAADVTTGACGGTVHRRLIREAQRALKEARESGIEVRWGWIKGHSDHVWNEIADQMANRGRAGAEEGPKEEKPDRKKRHPALLVQQIVDAEAVRKATLDRSLSGEASRWARGMLPRGDGTATVQTHYVRNSRFGRRNAEGVSLQFCSKELRQRIAGKFYIEIDIKSSHPTMLRTRLARLGKRIKLLDEWVEDKETCAERIAAETELTHGVRPPAAAVKDVILAAINGASVEKWVSSKWGIPHAPLTLARFARDLATVRANAHIWFPEIWSDVDAKRSDWKRRSSTIFFAMTSLEDEVLEAIREALPQFGVQCDALTGDGLLARPIYESASPLPNVLRALEANVFDRTGVAIKLGGKTLHGEPAETWPASLSAHTRPASGHPHQEL